MLDLLAFFKENDIYPDHDEFNCIKYSGEMLFYIGLGKTISFYSGNYDLDYIDETAEKDETFEAFVHKAANRCVKHSGCLENPGLRRAAFGQVYENSCRSTYCFKVPPLKNFVFIKRVAEIRKRDIDNMPENKRALRADINEMLSYSLKSLCRGFCGLSI